ncbi:hypothetical protein [Endothiovibrio diazotrophicus]
MFAEILDRTTAENMRTSIDISRLPAGHPMLAANAPTNQQILDETKKFYAAHQNLVDIATNNASSAARDKTFVNELNNNTQAFRNKSLPGGAIQLTSESLFGDAASGGIFGPILKNIHASDLFTTIGVGVSAQVEVFVGGFGGLGCAFDILNRESPRGYGYATGELGFAVAFDVNLQLLIFNKLPSNLNLGVYGATVTADVGLGATFAPFFTTEKGTPTILGFSVAIGAGLGLGVSAFAGHIWAF